jgi:hypothetical protein
MGEYKANMVDSETWIRVARESSGSWQRSLTARKLAQYDGGKQVPATVAAISDGVRWAVEIMREIDEKFPSKSGLQKTTLG